jgi:putative peptidoglycan lipid II flippase
LFKTESYSKGILYSTGLSICAKMIGFANGIVIAYYFGTQVKTDIYFYAISTVNLLAGFLNVLDHGVIIPEAMRIKEQGGIQKSQEFISFFLYMYSIIALVVILILLLNPVSAFVHLSKFEIASLENNIFILYSVLPLLLLIIISNYLINILSSYKYFTLPMLVTMINNCFSLMFILVFQSKLGIGSILIGLTFGYVFNVMILYYIFIRKLKWKFTYKYIKLGKKNGSNIVYTIVGQITSFFGTFLPMYLMSGFSQGIVTSMNFGRNLAQLPDQFITVQFSTVTAIKMNELFANNKLTEINTLFNKTVNYLFFILIPMSCYFYLYSEEIVTLLYKRGAFDADAVSATASFFKWFGLTLPFIALNTIVARLYMAGQEIKSQFTIGIMVSVFYLLLLCVLVKNIGPVGYPISVLIYLPISLFIVYAIHIRKVFPFIKFNKVYISFVKIVIVNIGVVSCVYFSSKMFNGNIIMQLLMSAFAYVALLIILNQLLSIDKIAKDQIANLGNKILRIK